MDLCPSRRGQENSGSLNGVTEMRGKKGFGPTTGPAIIRKTGNIDHDKKTQPNGGVRVGYNLFRSNANALTSRSWETKDRISGARADARGYADGIELVTIKGKGNS